MVQSGTIWYNRSVKTDTTPQPTAPALLHRLPWLVPLLLFALALLLRVQTLDWGLPYVEHADEPTFVRIPVRMVQDQSLHPYDFQKPTFYFYLLAALTQLHVWWGTLTGLYTSAADLPRNTFFFTTAPQHYVWLRSLTALFGAASVVATYYLGMRLYGWWVGLLAGLLLAFSSFHIEHSQYVTTDVPVGFWLTLMLLAVWQVQQHGAWRAYLLTGVLLGLATSTKYNAVATGGVLLLAHAFYWQRQSVGVQPMLRLVGAGVATVLAFFATSPLMLLDWQFGIGNMLFQVDAYSPGTPWYAGGEFRLSSYLSFIWREALLPIGSLLLLAGLPLLLRRAPRATLLLLLAIALQIGLLLSFTVHFYRNMLTVFPAMVVLAAAGVVALARLLPPLRGRRLAGGGLALLLLVPQALDTGWLLRYWSQPHTLVAAAADLRDTPRGMLAAVDTNPVQWADDPVVEPLERVCQHAADWYRVRGYRYLLLSDERQHRTCDPAYNDPAVLGTVISRYPPRLTGERVGPGVVLLDLGQDADALLLEPRRVAFGAELTLLGYELQPGDLRARITPLEGANQPTLPAEQEQPVQVNLYWQVQQPPTLDYWLFVHVYNAAGERVAQRDAPLRPDYPPTRWQAGELVIERADLLLPPLPPGDYRLEIGVYDPASFARLPANDPAARDGSVLLAEVRVE